MKNDSVDREISASQACCICCSVCHEPDNGPAVDMGRFLKRPLRHYDSHRLSFAEHPARIEIKKKIKSLNEHDRYDPYFSKYTPLLHAHGTRVHFFFFSFQLLSPINPLKQSPMRDELRQIKPA